MSEQASRFGGHVLIIGVGNDARGDDAVGLVVARELAGRGLPGVSVTTVQRDGSALIAAWQGTGAAQVILIDAAVSGAAPGTVRRLVLSEDSVPLLNEGVSTHSIGVAQAVELARVLGCMPPSLVLYAIEAGQFDLEAGLSPAVAAAVPVVASSICDDVGGSG